MILDDLVTYLDAQSTALSLLSGTGGNLSKAFMPDASPAPNTMVTLYETGGRAPVHVFTTSTQTRLHEQPTVQVLSRSSSYQTARNNAETVFGILDGIANTLLPTATGIRYVSIEAIQSPFSIGRDANDRHLVSCNYQIMKATG
jgi:hypothetical protein